MKKIKIKAFIKRAIVSVLVVVMLVCLPMLGMGKDENMSLIYNVFVGAKSKYQGIIEIWNIDTFESGMVSKTKLLSGAAANFQNKHKGVYVLIRNVTENECKNMLNSGQKPDLFSCSYGVSNLIKDYLMPFENDDYNLKNNYLNAGKNENGDIMALAWCSGLYYLMSTKNNIEKAGVEVAEDFNLLNKSLSLGYTKEGKTKTTVYSLGFGMGDYQVPQKALSSYNDNGELSVSENSYNLQSVASSSYSAYCKFLAGESVVLLGTQRDVVRMKNRESQGKISDVMCQPLTKFSDLIQFVFLSKDEDEKKNEYKKMFAEFLLEKEHQQRVANSGLFSVSNACDLKLNTSVMQDIVFDKISDLELNNVFLSFENLDNLRKINF